MSKTAALALVILAHAIPLNVAMLTSLYHLQLSVWIMTTAFKLSGGVKTAPVLCLLQLVQKREELVMSLNIWINVALFPADFVLMRRLLSTGWVATEMTQQEIWKPI
jgi:hypothetical protein